MAITTSINTVDHVAREPLTALVDAQLTDLGRAVEATRERRGMIERADVEGLETNVNQRGAVLRAVAGRAGEIARLAAALEETDRAGLQHRLDAIDDLMAELSRMDREDAAVLGAWREQTERELAGLTTSRRCAAAYGSPGVGGSPRLEDRRG